MNRLDIGTGAECGMTVRFPYGDLVSWDLDIAEARELAEEYLSAMPPFGNDEWTITRIEERDWGWIVSWLNRRAAEGSTSTDDTHAGAGPFLIDRQTGHVAVCGTAHPVDHYVTAWRNGTYPNTPRP